MLRSYWQHLVAILHGDYHGILGPVHEIRISFITLHYEDAWPGIHMLRCHALTLDNHAIQQISDLGGSYVA